MDTDLICVSGLDMAYSEHSAELAAQAIGERFGVLVQLEGKVGGGGWPTVSLIGTPGAILRALTEEGGWSTGDAEDDAQTVLAYFSIATPVYGTL